MGDIFKYSSLKKLSKKELEQRLKRMKKLKNQFPKHPSGRGWKYHGRSGGYTRTQLNENIGRISRVLGQK